MWIFPKMLCSPDLASFADSKLLDFSRASDTMTLHIPRDTRKCRNFLAQHTSQLVKDAVNGVMRIPLHAPHQSPHKVG